MLRKEVQQGVLIITPKSKRIDVIASPLLRKQLQEAIDDENTASVVLNLSGVEFIDSAGLVSFLAIWKHLRKKNGDLKVASAQPQVQQIIELVLLNRVFSLHPTVEEAINAFKPALKSKY